MQGPAAGFQRLVEVLDSLGIRYMVGGSLATSIYGIPRSTNDIYIVADVEAGSVAPLVAALQTEFYVDAPEVIQQALRAGRMFNLIHLASSYKFDIYPLGREPYDLAAFARRQLDEHALEGCGGLRFSISSVEDAILAKLRWYRAGKQIAQTQWNDVVDVIRVKKDLLDYAYLRHWAQELELATLLEEALRQAAGGVDSSPRQT